METGTTGSSSDVLMWVLIGAGVLVLLGAVLLALWLGRRRSATAAPHRGPAAYGPAAGAPGPVAAGWYPDPHGQARLRWFDGRSWTGSTQT